MNSAEFIKYISNPLTIEEMHLLYKANNVNYDKCKLYHDFILTLRISKKILFKGYCLLKTTINFFDFFYIVSFYDKWLRDD